MTFGLMSYFSSFTITWQHWAGRGVAGGGGEAKPLHGYETWLLHHPAGFVACGVGTLQLVECRLVYLSEELESELGGKSVNGCWYGPRKKNSCDWGRRISWPKAGEWAEEVGSSGCIVWHLVAVGWCCVRANGVFSGRDLIGKLRNSLWLFCQNNSIRILPLCYGQKKVLNFTMGKMHGSYLNLLCQTPGGGKSFLNIGHPPF